MTKKLLALAIVPAAVLVAAGPASAAVDYKPQAETPTGWECVTGDPVCGGAIFLPFNKKDVAQFDNAENAESGKVTVTLKDSKGKKVPLVEDEDTTASDGWIHSKGIVGLRWFLPTGIKPGVYKVTYKFTLGKSWECSLATKEVCKFQTGFKRSGTKTVKVKAGTPTWIAAEAE